MHRWLSNIIISLICIFIFPINQIFASLIFLYTINNGTKYVVHRWKTNSKNVFW